MKNNDVHYYTTPSHIVWEGVGSEVVIRDTTSHTTYRLYADAATVFLHATEGRPVPVTPEVIALEQRGFLEPRSPMSRRTLMAGGVAGLGLGITSLSLPAAAQASSTTPKTQESPPPTPTITAASLEPGKWRWSVGPNNGVTTLRINQTDDNTALPTTGAFVVGDVWRLSLEDFDGPPAEATVTEDNSGPETLLNLLFLFPLTGGVTAPSPGTELEGTLTLISDTSVFSEPFPIPQFVLS